MVLDKRFIVSMITIALVTVAACAPAAQPAPAAAPAAPKAPAQPAAPAPASAPQTTVAAPAATPKPAVELASTPKRGGTIRVIPPSLAGGLDPYKNSTSSLKYLGAVYLKMLRAKRADQFYAYEYVPDLAESWQIIDPTTMIFKLKKGVKWAPVPPLNGREVTAEDVKYSYTRFAFDPNSIVRGELDLLKDVEVLDKYTVKLTAKRPSAFLIDLGRIHPAWIIPREVVEQEGDLQNVMLGAGPFYMEKLVKGVGYYLTRNPNYWDQPKPYVDKMEWLDIPDAAAQIAAFRGGQIDFLERQTKLDKDAILRSNPDTLVDKALQGGISWLILHANEPDKPWNDKRVRIALSKAIDRDGMLDALWKDEGDIGGILPSGYSPWGLSTEEKRKIDFLKFDPKEAKRLMTEAGYPNGFKSVLCHFGKGVPPSPAGMMGVQMWKENLNVDIDVSQTRTQAEGLKFCFTGNYSGIANLGHGGVGEWFKILFAQFHSQGKWHSSGIKSKELDAMIEDIEATLDDKERLRKVHAIQRYALDLGWWSPLPAGPFYMLSKPRLRGWAPNASDNSYLADVWVAQ